MSIEEVTLPAEEALGIVEIKGDRFESALLVNGGAVTFCFADGEGSIGQYLAHAGFRASPLLEQIRAAVRDRPHGPLESHFWPVLKLFRAGAYTLEHLPSASPVDVIEAEPFASFYPVGQMWVSTRADETLDAVRLREQERAIERGERPCVVLASADGCRCDYVVDGHHKLRAYRNLGKAPAAVRVHARAQRPLAAAERDALLATSPEALQVYSAAKRRRRN